MIYDYILLFRKKGAIIGNIKKQCQKRHCKIIRESKRGIKIMFIILAGGLLIIIFAVVVSVVSSVVSAVAADADESAD